MSDESRGAETRLWSDVEAMEVSDVCLRADVAWDSGAYRIRHLGSEYAVVPFRRVVLSPDGATPAGRDLELLFLGYLRHAREVPLVKRWVTEKDLPGGSGFFRGPHALDLGPLAARYAEDRNGFLAKASELGGNVLEFGDVSAQVPALPRIPVAFVLWAGDDEFPPSASAMFDWSLRLHLPLDIVLALVGRTLRALLA